MHARLPVKGPRRSLVLLATLGVVGLPQVAAVADEVTAVTGSAFGYFTDVSLFGGPSEERGPAPTVALATDASNSPLHATVSSAAATYGPAVVFRSGRIDVHAEAALGTDGYATTSSTVLGDPDPSQRPEPFVYDAVSSSCSADASGTAVTTTITSGVVGTRYDDSGERIESEAVPTSPAPGYTIEGTLNTGDSFRIVFNEQQVLDDGSVSVIAAHLYLLGPTAVGDVVIGHSACGLTAVPGDPGDGDPGDGDPGDGDPGDGDPGEITTGRLAGGTRFGTAAAIALHQFPAGAETVYLARGDNVVDAVAGGVLTDGPILLVPSCDVLPEVVVAALEALGAQAVTALGGPSAICDGVLADAAAASGG